MEKETLQTALRELRNEIPLCKISCYRCNHCEVSRSPITYYCKLHKIKIHNATQDVCFSYTPIDVR